MQVQSAITNRLTEDFKPEYLKVINESSSHNVPVDSETHFKVIIASERFASLRPVKRQQLVYQALAEFLEGPVHALSMATYDLEQWAENPESQASPPCLGGSGS